MVQLPYCCHIIPLLRFAISIDVDAQDNKEFNAVDTTEINAFPICLYGTRHAQMHCLIFTACHFVTLYRKLSEHSFYYFRNVAATEQLTIPHMLVSPKLLQAVMHSVLPALEYADVIPFIRNFVKIGQLLQQLQVGTHRQQTAGCIVGRRA
jgi:hypothetical protein